MRSDVAFYSPLATPLMGDAPRAAPGGAEKQIVLVARELAAAGFRVSHVVNSAPGLPREYAGVRVVPRRRSQVGRTLGAVREPAALWSALVRANARAYVHPCAGVEVSLTAAFCRSARRKFVFSAQNIIDFTGEQFAHNRRYWDMYVWALRHADLVAVQTDDQLELARELVPEERVRVVPSLVERAEPGAAGDSFLWIGRAVDYKDPRAYLELARAMPDARFEMVVLESDDPAHGIPIADLGRDADGLDNVTLFPGLGHEELMQRLSRARALISTSTIEGLPNVFLEAWSRGVPVLSYRFDPDGRIAAERLGIAADGSWDAFVDGARALWQDSDGRRAAIAAYMRSGAHDPARVRESWRELFAELGVAPAG